jgi:alpha-D-xyloside xylohydrolase
MQLSISAMRGPSRIMRKIQSRKLIPNRRKNNAGELLDGWERLEDRCREIIGWRMQMVPYLMAAFARYAEVGTPPFRALVLDAPQDHRLRNVDDQYMVGDRMMVAPLFAGEPGRKAVLPDGDWHDFWTGERIKSGRDLQVSASTERECGVEAP